MFSKKFELMLTTLLLFFKLAHFAQVLKFDEMDSVTVLGRNYKKSEIKKFTTMFSSTTFQKVSFVPWTLTNTKQNCASQPNYPLRKEGEKCDPLASSLFECDSPLICDAKGICVNTIYDDIGKNCTSSCSSYPLHKVISNLVCINGVCNYYRKEGEPCKAKNECYSEQCTAGKCVDKKFNETCTTTEQCLFPNLYCNKGKCDNKIDENQPCTDSQVCKSNLECLNNKCTYNDFFSNCKSKNILQLAFTEIFTSHVCYPDNFLRKKYLLKKGEKCLYGFHCSEGLACTKNGICEDAVNVQCANYTLPYATQWNRTDSSCPTLYCDCKNPASPVCPIKIDPYLGILSCVSSTLFDFINCSSVCGPSAQFSDSNNCAFKKCKSVVDQYFCCWKKYYPGKGSFKVPTSGLGDYKFDPTVCSNISGVLISKPSKFLLLFIFLVGFIF